MHFPKMEFEQLEFDPALKNLDNDAQFQPKQYKVKELFEKTPISPTETTIRLSRRQRMALHAALALILIAVYTYFKY